MLTDRMHQFSRNASPLDAKGSSYVKWIFIRTKLLDPRLFDSQSSHLKRIIGRFRLRIPLLPRRGIILPLPRVHVAHVHSRSWIALCVYAHSFDTIPWRSMRVAQPQWSRASLWETSSLCDEFHRARGIIHFRKENIIRPWDALCIRQLARWCTRTQHNSCTRGARSARNEFHRRRVVFTSVRRKRNLLRAVERFFLPEVHEPRLHTDVSDRAYWCILGYGRCTRIVLPKYFKPELRSFTQCRSCKADLTGLANKKNR